jgi:hypothetical protein
MRRSECPACGLVQAPNLAVCRECGGWLRGDSAWPTMSPERAGRSVRELPGNVRDNRSRSMEPVVWRDGKLLVFDSWAELPDRCLRCNAPAEGNKIKKTFRLSRPGLDLLALVAPLFGIVLFLIPAPTAKVRLCFCRDHMNRLRLMMVGNWGVLVLGLAFIIWGAAAQSGALALIGSGLVIASGTIGTMAGRYASVRRIDGNYVWLAGVSKAYLSELPSIPQRGPGFQYPGD